MPIFEYQCRSCRFEYEYLVLSQSEGVLNCPRCGSSNAQKIMSTASVVRSPSQKATDRASALANVNPSKPQEVARYFKEYGSRFGDSDFRGTKAWKNAVDRVSEGGPTLEEE
jgi:putative FmdB family regulatory protein